MIKVLSTAKYFIAYLFIGLAIGSYFPILTLYLHEDLYVSEFKIGTLMATITILPIFTLPIWGILTDKIKSPKISLIISLFFSTILIFSLAFIKTYHLFFIIISIFMIFRSPIFALYDEILINVCKEKRINYGSLRAGASIGFAISTIIGTYYALNFGNEIRFILSSIFFFIVCIILIISEDVKYKEKEKINIKEDLPILFKNKYFLIICLLIGITYGINDSNLSFMSSYLKIISKNDNIIGIAVFFSVIIEFPILYYTKYIYRKLSLKQIFLFINIINIFRYLLFFLYPNYVTILLLAPIHGITYGISYPMIILYTSENVRKKVLATGYTILSAITGTLTALISFLTGYLYELFEFKIIFLLFLSLHIINIILIILLLKNYNYRAKTI